MSAIVNFNQNEGLFVIASGLLHSKSSSSLNLPVIPTFRDIANLIECMAMFYFIKGQSVCRIVTEPCSLFALSSFAGLAVKDYGYD